MSNELRYAQCRLEKPTPTGTLEQTSYLPVQFAVVGKVLKLRGDDGIWSDGWRVLSAGEPREIGDEESYLWRFAWANIREGP